MRVGLFIPCFVDQLHPEVAVATLELLRGLGVVVVYPEGQTCCGQPSSNCGDASAVLPALQHFARVFDAFDRIVCPSASCVAMVRHRYPALCAEPGIAEVASRCFELCEFLTDELDVQRLPARLPRRVALLSSCHGLRDLGLGTPSECVTVGGPGSAASKPERLLAMVEGLQLVHPERPDECCGFGGTFAVTHGPLSVHMGRDRLDVYRACGAELLVGTDSSCLLHLSMISEHQGSPLPTAHIAQVLAGKA